MFSITIIKDYIRHSESLNEVVKRLQALGYKTLSVNRDIAMLRRGKEDLILRPLTRGSKTIKIEQSERVAEDKGTHYYRKSVTRESKEYLLNIPEGKMCTCDWQVRSVIRVASTPQTHGGKLYVFVYTYHDDPKCGRLIKKSKMVEEKDEQPNTTK